MCWAYKLTYFEIKIRTCISRPLMSRFGFFWSHTSVRSQQDPIQAYQLNGCGICSCPSYSQNTVNIKFNAIFAPWKEIHNILGFWILRRGFQIPGYLFQSLSLELGFWIPVVSGIPDSLSCIPDSKVQDLGFHKQKFPCLWNSDSLTWGEKFTS